jgi:hypothetical protein
MAFSDGDAGFVSAAHMAVIAAVSAADPHIVFFRWFEPEPPLDGEVKSRDCGGPPQRRGGAAAEGAEEPAPRPGRTACRR